jgi:hypothetical protein
MWITPGDTGTYPLRLQGILLVVLASVGVGCGRDCHPAAFRRGPYNASLAGDAAHYVALEAGSATDSLTSSQTSYTIKVFDTRTGHLLDQQVIKARDGYLQSALSVDGQRFTLLEVSRRARTWSLAPLKLISDEVVPLALKTVVTRTAVGAAALVAQQSGQTITLDALVLPGLATLGRVSLPVPTEGCPTVGWCSVSMSSDGKSILLSAASGASRYSLGSAELLSSLTYEKAESGRFPSTPDPSLTISSTSADGGTVALGTRVWDFSGKTAQLLFDVATLDAHVRAGTGQVSGDGSRFMFALSGDQSWSPPNYLVVDRSGAVISRTSGNPGGVMVMDDAARFLAVNKPAGAIGTDVYIRDFDSGRETALAQAVSVCDPTDSSGTDYYYYYY